MEALAFELASFLPWCWGVNIALNLLGYAKRNSPTFARFDRPLDGGCILPDGDRLLGTSTTWIGLALVIGIGALGTMFASDSLFFIYALSVYVGHALGSFLKRRLRIPSGSFLPIVDHGDSVFLAGIVGYAFGALSFIAVLAALLLTLAVTPLVTLVAHGAGLREKPL